MTPRIQTTPPPVILEANTALSICIRRQTQETKTCVQASAPVNQPVLVAPHAAPGHGIPHALVLGGTDARARGLQALDAAVDGLDVHAEGDVGAAAGRRADELGLGDAVAQVAEAGLDGLELEDQGADLLDGRGALGVDLAQEGELAGEVVQARAVGADEGPDVPQDLVAAGGDAGGDARGDVVDEAQVVLGPGQQAQDGLGLEDEARDAVRHEGRVLDVLVEDGALAEGLAAGGLEGREEPGAPLGELRGRAVDGVGRERVDVARGPAVDADDGVDGRADVRVELLQVRGRAAGHVDVAVELEGELVLGLDVAVAHEGAQVAHRRLGALHLKGQRDAVGALLEHLLELGLHAHEVVELDGATAGRGRGGGVAAGGGARGRAEGQAEEGDAGDAAHGRHGGVDGARGHVLRDDEAAEDEVHGEQRAERVLGVGHGDGDDLADPDDEPVDGRGQRREDVALDRLQRVEHAVRDSPVPAARAVAAVKRRLAPPRAPLDRAPERRPAPSPHQRLVLAVVARAQAKGPQRPGAVPAAPPVGVADVHRGHPELRVGRAEGHAPAAGAAARRDHHARPERLAQDDLLVVLVLGEVADAVLRAGAAAAAAAAALRGELRGEARRGLPAGERHEHVVVVVGADRRQDGRVEAVVLALDHAPRAVDGELALGGQGGAV
ncbi:hypothetical protein TOPH_03924, partial [Tolypocladium ophioglossoides CBS 100239]